MKKLITVVCLSVVFTIAAFASTTIGDVDGNGKFSLTDVIETVKAVSRADLTEEELYVYDIDKSGAVTLKDVLKLARLTLNGEKPSLCDINNVYHEGCIWDYLDIGQYDVLSFTSQEYPSIKMRFRIYVPASYSPHKSYALVTHLHGLGGEDMKTSELSGSTFFSNIRRSDYREDTILLLPQCPVDMSWPDNRETITVAYKLIMDLCKHLSIDESRLYLSGHSNGSKGVAYMLMEHPNTFAAAVMGSGASGLSYYTNLENIATASIWMFIGTADTSPGFLTNVRNLYNALDQMGADVKLTEFEGLKHNIFSTVGETEGLVEWVFSKTLSK